MWRVKRVPSVRNRYAWTQRSFVLCYFCEKMRKSKYDFQSFLFYILQSPKKHVLESDDFIFYFVFCLIFEKIVCFFLKRNFEKIVFESRSGEKNVFEISL